MTKLSFTISDPGDNGLDLQRKLQTISTSYTNPSYHITINLGPGVHFLNSRVEIKCNLTLIGTDARPTIQVANSVVTQVAAGSSPALNDAILSFMGTTSTRIDVRIENINFTCQSDSQKVRQETHYVKVTFGQSVVFKNISSTLCNGAITNFDLRFCQNITVEGCEITNRNYPSKDNSGNGNADVLGGCLWIRGSVASAKIHSNKFVKCGADEILAFWFPESLEPTGSDPALHIDTYRHNIDVHDNQLVYERMASNNSVVYASNVVLIKFYNDKSTPVEWKNISFRDNDIKVEGFCKKVIGFTMHSNDTASQVNIYRNRIEHSNTLQNSDYSTVVDFEITGSGANASIHNYNAGESSYVGSTEPIIIENNFIIARETLGTNAIHSCLIAGNSNVIFRSNEIYAGYQKSGTSNNFMIYMIKDNYTSIQLLNNQCHGIKRLGQVISTTRSYYNINFLIKGNFFDGPIWQYLPGLASASYIFAENTCINGNYYLMFQEFSNSGNVEIVNNMFQRTTSANATTGTMYYTATTSPSALTRLVIAGNNLVGYSTSVITGSSSNDNCWTATKKAIGNNNSVIFS